MRTSSVDLPSSPAAFWEGIRKWMPCCFPSTESNKKEAIYKKISSHIKEIENLCEDKDFVNPPLTKIEKLIERGNNLGRFLEKMAIGGMTLATVSAVCWAVTVNPAFGPYLTLVCICSGLWQAIGLLALSVLLGVVLIKAFFWAADLLQTHHLIGKDRIHTLSKKISDLEKFGGKKQGLTGLPYSKFFQQKLLQEDFQHSEKKLKHYGETTYSKSCKDLEERISNLQKKIGLCDISCIAMENIAWGGGDSVSETIKPLQDFEKFVNNINNFTDEMLLEIEIKYSEYQFGHEKNQLPKKMNGLEFKNQFQDDIRNLTNLKNQLKELESKGEIGLQQDYRKELKNKVLTWVNNIKESIAPRNHV